MTRPPVLQSRFARNLGAMGGAQMAIRLARLATTILLTRLLSPMDYGLAAIVLTVYEIVALFTRNGISARVVQADAEHVEAVAHTALTLTWIVCGVLVVLQALVAVPIAWAYHDMRLALPIALMGLIYLATPPCNIQGAMMQRDGRLGRIALTGAMQLIVDNVLTAVFAALGFGMWAIIAPKLLVAPIWVIGIRYGHTWRPTGGWSLTGWRDIARYSRFVMGVELLSTLQANVDNLIVGAALGVEALGIYYFAFNAGLGITLGLVNALGAAVFPHLCAVRKDPDALAERFCHGRRTLGLLIVPLVLAQAALAPIYVPIVFGARWTPAIPVLMLICLSALPRPFASATSQLLKAVGRPEIELRWQAALTIVLVLGLLAGTQGGILGVAGAVLAVQGAMLSLYAFFAPRRVLPRREPPHRSIAIIRDLDGLLALEPEWNELFQRAGAPGLSRSFGWCMAGWRTTGQPRGRTLCVIVVREAGRVELIWPMTLRRRLFWREAIALGGENTEYDPVLVAPRPDAETLLRAAWTFAKRRSGFALATVPFIDQASPVYAILPQGSRRRKEHTLPAPIVRFGEFANWDAYWRSRSANLRNGLNRRRRRLAECGAVTSRWIEDDAEYEELLDWALACKRDWLKQQGLASDHIGQDRYRAFLLAARQADIPNGRLAMMAMHINEVPIAVKIGCIDPTRFEGFITTYDPAWSAHSPGQLLLADCLAWCQETGRDYDFRIGEETYKSGWTSDARLVSRVTITNGVAGGIIIGADTLSRHFRAVGDRLRQAIPLPWRRRAKALFTPVILQPLPAEA